MVAESIERRGLDTSQRPGAEHLAFLDGIRGFARFYLMFQHGVLELPAAPPEFANAAAGLETQGPR